jgi:glutamate:Na+ symporter, ESS family
VILAVASVAWSVFVTMVIGPRVFPENWFEHSLAEFGESQGNVATGFVMVDMVDPARQTDVVSGYSDRQLVTRPMVGGGFLSAMSVPLIASIGLTAFTVGALTISIAMTLWGIRHARVSRIANSGFTAIPRRARG